MFVAHYRMRTDQFTSAVVASLVIAMVVSSCGLLGPSQAERDMGKTLEVYRVLESRYIDRDNLDVLALNEGAVQGLLEALEISTEGFDARFVLSTADTEDMEGLLATYEVLAETYFVREEVDLDIINERAIIRMLETLNDPFTNYFDPRGFEHSTEHTIEGTFSGIGAEVSLINGLLTVVAPIPDSPAERVGILAGDILIEADGTSLKGLSLDAGIDLIRGPQGSIIKLKVYRTDNDEDILFEIKRDTIEHMTVRVEDLDRGLARVRITRFANPTDEQVEDALETLSERKTQGVVLDLRNNPGGVLESVVLVASEFLDEGLVLYELDADGKRTDHDVQKDGLAVDMPLVVLVNGGSASGSEVLAGALQSHGRATVLGTQTFGKGVVNLPVELSDGSGLFITIARWYTPSGGQIGNVGITPDVISVLTTSQDTQLEDAIDILEQTTSPTTRSAVQAE